MMDAGGVCGIQVGYFSSKALLGTPTHCTAPPENLLLRASQLNGPADDKGRLAAPVPVTYSTTRITHPGRTGRRAGPWTFGNEACRSPPVAHRIPFGAIPSLPWP
jgi:hypothetical protein